MYIIIPIILYLFCGSILCGIYELEYKEIVTAYLAGPILIVVISFQIVAISFRLIGGYAIGHLIGQSIKKLIK